MNKTKKISEYGYSFQVKFIVCLITDKLFLEQIVDILDGKYTIKVGKGQTLVFSFIGYNTIERIVGNSNVINVQLKEGNTLDTVEITAVGQIVKKENGITNNDND